MYLHVYSSPWITCAHHHLHIHALSIHLQWWKELWFRRRVCARFCLSLIPRCTIRSFWCSIINKCSTIFQLNRCLLFIYLHFLCCRATVLDKFVLFFSGSSFFLLLLLFVYHFVGCRFFALLFLFPLLLLFLLIREQYFFSLSSVYGFFPCLMIRTSVTIRSILFFRHVFFF